MSEAESNAGFSPELASLFEEDTDGLYDAPEKPAPVTHEDRLHRAFREVMDFYRDNGRAPDPDCREIAERKLGARLVGIRASDWKLEALLPMDEFGLLAEQKAPESLDALLDSLDEDDVLSDILNEDDDILSVSSLPARTPRPAESVARRHKAEGFEAFAPMFKQKHRELAEGTVTLAEPGGERSIAAGKFYLLKGALAFVAEVHEPEPDAPLNRQGRPKQRLRLIFENGTESAMYQESFYLRLYEEDGKVLARADGVDVSEIGDADVESGHIYVLRSLSDAPEIASLSDLHKIGYCTTNVAQRIRGAEKSATYLNAPVEVVADYRTYNLRPSALEHLLHRVFSKVRLDATVETRNFDSVHPQAATEWFLAPLQVIDDAVEKIISGEITDYVYDPALQKLRRI